MILNSGNVEANIQKLLASVEEIDFPSSSFKGVALLRLIKRDEMKKGPYPGVSLFEAANRIMSDLVILYGVCYLLKESKFPFDSYSVNLGHAQDQKFDIEARQNGRLLIGEAFNVSPDFFQIKKRKMLKKMFPEDLKADYKLILCNKDAVRDKFKSKHAHGEHYLFVSPGFEACELISPIPE